MSRVIHTRDVKKQWNIALKDKQTDICICWNHSHRCFSWLSAADMQQQMKMWRKQAKQDTMKICAYNNRDVDVDGKMWYIMIVQPYKDGDLDDCNLDPAAMSIFGIMVDGYCYAFEHKENRDKTYKYVMKGIEEKTEVSETKEEITPKMKMRSFGDKIVTLQKTDEVVSPFVATLRKRVEVVSPVVEEAQLSISKQEKMALKKSAKEEKAKEEEAKAIMS